ncbi:hypothetical protein PtrCC142_009661 [Pyrenophora tritici-repentis]|nr:hypothetical protein Alg215_04617 [Pyrenophora tritici-repentis]KAI1528204.1 hypothetical protein PtrSN001C_009555 [Pyrenophora tritici-repentis]KAI1528557.1 hypothetical protein PtrSN001A_008911 [Pyrenophora tritici-repentis]KAI1596412.1 hypothetical protein PtrCC142_009661 [Pyrenophora tritici-repentis]
MDPDIDAYYNRHRPAPFYQYPDPRFNLPPIFSFLPANNPATLQLSPQLIPKKPPTSTRPLIPGSYNPSAIHSTSISSLSRIKLHLRHRTYEPVTFYFPSPDQDNLREFSQDVDANLLMAVSPDYATRARVDPEDTAFVVPAPFTARTVNIFIFFEREMGVTWIVDMVVDQLLFLFDRQCKNKAALNDIGHPVNGYVNARGRKVFLGYKLPNIDKPLPTLLVDDFWMEVLQRFVGGTKDLDVATLSFVGDLMNGLHIEVDRTWLAGTQATVQDILSRSSDDYPNVLRPLSEYYINALYAMDMQERVKLSGGLPMVNSLAGLVCSRNGDTSRLRKDVPSAEMLEAEKMVLATDCRLEEAKAALWTVRDADVEEKLRAIHEAAYFFRALVGTCGG